ncbi:glycosyltransferase [Leptospira idonii]|uniref:Glycosyltransferase n=1 Tax=Leptospira idonii TaxID=1193500 RepID=A0A4R9LXL7_9LEPT|nr:glycosyltransferase [Leptospira idonii]TGN18311.1 glycosyltransferase [Leptospira idonii]
MIVAVIVTRNRLELLKNCIQSVLSQTQKPNVVLVVDNDSTDGTRNWLQEQKGLQVILNENTGGAGGFHRGMAEAIRVGAKWVWLMDDDGYPDKDALKRLSDRIGTKDVSAWNSLVLEKPGSSVLSFGYSVLKKSGDPALSNSIRELETLKENAKEGLYPWGSFFNGSLIDVASLEQIGLVNPGFFIWGDETNLHMRLRKWKPVYTVLDSYHYHPVASFQTMPSWKLFYALRNGIYNSLRFFPDRLIRVSVVIFRYVPKLLFRFEIRLIGKALWEGFSGKIRSWGIQP